MLFADGEAALVEGGLEAKRCFRAPNHTSPPPGEGGLPDQLKLFVFSSVWLGAFADVAGLAGGGIGFPFGHRGVVFGFFAGDLFVAGF